MTITTGCGPSGPMTAGRRDLAGCHLGHRRRGPARERSNLMTTLKVGIASYEAMKARTMAVARGERRIVHR
jgi:hypothetical protein